MDFWSVHTYSGPSSKSPLRNALEMSTVRRCISSIARAITTRIVAFGNKSVLLTHQPWVWPIQSQLLSWWKTDTISSQSFFWYDGNWCLLSNQLTLSEQAYMDCSRLCTGLLPSKCYVGPYENSWHPLVQGRVRTRPIWWHSSWVYQNCFPGTHVLSPCKSQKPCWNILINCRSGINANNLPSCHSVGEHLSPPLQLSSNALQIQLHLAFTRLYWRCRCT